MLSGMNFKKLLLQSALLVISPLLMVALGMFISMSSYRLFRNSIKEKRSWVKNVVGKTFILAILIVIYQGFSSFRNRSRPIEDFIDDSFRVNLYDSFI